MLSANQYLPSNYWVHSTGRDRGSGVNKTNMVSLSIEGGGTGRSVQGRHHTDLCSRVGPREKPELPTELAGLGLCCPSESHTSRPE